MDGGRAQSLARTRLRPMGGRDTGRGWVHRCHRPYYLRFSAPFTPAIEAAWRLAPAYWGKGYAYEAARAAIEDGFYRFGFEEIVAITTPAHRRSWSLMQRLGMNRDPSEDFDHPHVPDGHALKRHVLYRLRRPS